jgi:hypothetical protein
MALTGGIVAKTWQQQQKPPKCQQIMPQHLPESPSSMNGRVFVSSYLSN